MVWRRLEAYAETRLSPDLATTTRLRARVLAVAHRQAALARADAGLTVLPAIDSTAAPAPFSPQAQRLARTSAAARGRSAPPMGLAACGRHRARRIARGRRDGRERLRRSTGWTALRGARLWAETLTAAGGSLGARRGGARSAEGSLARDRRSRPGRRRRRRDGRPGGLRGDRGRRRPPSAILTGDDVAAAALETGVGHNLEVLQALMGRVPATGRARRSPRPSIGPSPGARSRRADPREPPRGQPTGA